MEEKNIKLSIILIGVSIGLIISIAGILVYKFYPRSDEVRKNGTVTKQLEVNHTNEDKKTEEKILDYSGKFEKDGSELIITKKGDNYEAEIGIFRLGSFNGPVTDIKDNKLTIKWSTSDNEIEFEFDYNTKILSVIKSNWNLLPKGNTIDFNNNDNNVAFNEEDVKKWLEDHKLIELYFISQENDFDISLADTKKYSEILGIYVLFGGIMENSVENITLNNEKYNYQYSYPISYIKSILNDIFGKDIDVININTMNKLFDGTANFSINNNLFTVKVAATGLDDYKTIKLGEISLNNNNSIVVRYNIKDCMVNGSTDNCINLGNREVILKKTDTGYNLLKAYKVEN